jgi:LexA DNA binding domain
MLQEDTVDIAKITSRVSGKRISHLTLSEKGQLAIHLADGSVLYVEPRPEGLAIDLASDKRSRQCAAAAQPTSRQQDYLEFIEKYMARFGFSPAESDIQRHFLVSAPSVNQMMQTLERHGFIQRERGVARSIRLVGAVTCAVCGETHHLKRASPGGVTWASTHPTPKRGWE